MKKYFFYAAAIMTAVTMIGCTDDEQGGNSQPKPDERKMVKKYTIESSAVEGITPKEEYIFTYNADNKLSRVDISEVSQYNNSTSYYQVNYTPTKISVTGKAGIGGPGERDMRGMEFTIANARATQAKYLVGDGYNEESIIDIVYDADGYIASTTETVHDLNYDDYPNVVPFTYEEKYTFTYTNGNLTKMVQDIEYFKRRNELTLQYDATKYKNINSVDFFGLMEDVPSSLYTVLCRYEIAGKRSAQIPVKLTYVKVQDGEAREPIVTNFSFNTNTEGVVLNYTRDDETDDSGKPVKFSFGY